MRERHFNRLDMAGDAAISQIPLARGGLICNRKPGVVADTAR